MDAAARKRDDINQYNLTDSEFAELSSIIYKDMGIFIDDSKRQLIYRRISVRLKTLGMNSFSEYIDLVKSRDPAEIEVFQNTITTNLTSFFRESHHFDYLAKSIIPEISAANKISKRLRIWSAGCSTGQEPYSIAITLRDAFPEIDIWDAKVLCTDLDTQVLQKCKSGVYSAKEMKNLPHEYRSRWFESVDGTADSDMVADKRLKDLLFFKQLNLMNEWQMQGKFDVIFCRNVVIYFDQPTKKKLMARFADYLAPGGYLILGHSESLQSAKEQFELIGKTIYKKVK